MTIRLKLNVIIFGIIGAFAIALALIMNTILLSEKIDRERAVLTDLLNAFHKISVSSSNLYVQDLRTSEEKFLEAMEQLDSVTESFGELTILPSLSDAINESFSVITSLSDLQSQGGREIYDRINRIKDLYGEMSGFDFSMIYGFIVADIPLNTVATGHESYETLLEARKNLFTSIRAIENTSSFEKLVQQNLMIRGEIEKINNRGFKSTLLITGLIIVVSIVLALITAYGIRKPLFGIRSTVKSLTGGDLGVSFSGKGNDEISELSSDLGVFLSELRSSVTDISLASDDNTSIRESMVGAIEETSAATRQIRANMNSIGNQFKALDQSIEKSVDSIGDIRSIISGESDQIREQLAMVEQATVSVKEMIASINHIALVTKENRAAAEELVSTAKSGGEKLKTTSGIISEINNSVEEIKGMTVLIQSVAGQTNLLAMNAAIEAAHAGESGKGFAVVADEIRKLAETSSRSSKEIGSSLKTIVERIAQADAAALETTDAFVKIDGEVHSVEKTFAEISGNMEELESGSHQILDAMNVLGQASTQVGRGADKMKEASHTVQDTISDVRRVSSESISNIGEMTAGIDEINTTIDHLVQLSSQVEEVSHSLNRAVSFFSLGQDSTTGQDKSPGQDTPEPQMAGMTGRAFTSAATPDHSEAIETVELEPVEV